MDPYGDIEEYMWSFFKQIRRCQESCLSKLSLCTGLRSGTLTDGQFRMIVYTYIGISENRSHIQDMKVNLSNAQQHTGYSDPYSLNQAIHILALQFDLLSRPLLSKYPRIQAANLGHMLCASPSSDI